MNGAAWGGSEEWWYKIAPWMANNGYQVEVIWFFWKDKAIKTKALEAKNVVVTHLPNPANGSSFLKKIILNVKLGKQLSGIKWDSYDMVIVNQGGFEDVIHGHFKQLYKKLKRYILVCHNYTEDVNLNSKQKTNLQHWLNLSIKNLGASDKIFMALAKLGLVIRNSNTLINPITFPIPNELHALPSLENGIIFIMLAALDIERKAQDLLIKTLSGSKWKERRWQLHLYGEGKDKKPLKALIKDNDLGSKIILKGHSVDVKNAIINSHVLLQITHKDAMPLAVVEAMSLGRPCVVSDVGDMAYWVLDGINGFVCTNATVMEIEDVLEKIWVNQNVLAALGKKSFEIFNNKYPKNYEHDVAGVLIKCI